MSRRLIRYLARKSGSHPAISLTLVLIITCVMGYLAATRLKIEMDVAAMLPSDLEITQQRSDAEWLFGLGPYDYMLCIMEIKESAPDQLKTPEEASNFLLSAQPLVKSALDDLRFFTRRGARLHEGVIPGLIDSDPRLVALLTDQDRNLFEERILPEQGLNETLVSIQQQIADDPTSDTLLALQDDPFGLNSLLERHSILNMGPLTQNYRGGGYVSEDNQMLLFVLWPAKPSTNLVRARELQLFLNETRDGLYQRNPEWRTRLDISFVGPHVENAEGTSDVRRDMILTSVVSLLAVLFLFVFAFRQPEALLFVAIPLIVGVIWTLGLSSLFIQRVTQITLTFAAILIGLGIDFSIHLYNRFLEDIRLGMNPQEALSNSTFQTGPSIMAGAITTGVAFFGMMATEFDGFRELGLFGGIGIFMCLIAVAISLPPLMMIFAKMTKRDTGPLATLGLKKVTFTVQSYPRMTVCAGMCIICYLGIHARNTEFNDDFQTLRQPSDSYLNLLNRIDYHFDLPSNQVLVITEGDTHEQALQTNDQIYTNIQGQTLYNFIGIDSLRSIYPSTRTQVTAIDQFMEIPVERIRESLQLRLEEFPGIPEGFFDPWFTEYEAIREQTEVFYRERRAPISFQTVDDPIFHDTVFSFFAQDAESNTYRIVTRLYPPDSQEWEEQVPETFLNDMLNRGIDQTPTVLGNAVFSDKLQELIVRDLTIVVLIVFFSVTGYLIWYFRSVGRAFLAMIPVIFALLAMLGLVDMMGMSLNYLNIIAIPMIVGVGVDSAIHLLGRFYEDDGHNMRFAIERTGRAIMVTGLTTIFGFGALTFASFQGIREIGLLAIFGTTCTLFAALVFLPAVLKLLDPKYTFTGGPGDEIG